MPRHAQVAIVATEHRYESRGVRCLECALVDLQGDKEAAKRGFGKCGASGVYVSVIMARNCLPFDPAPDEVVQARDAWADRLRMFWQK